MITDQKGAFRPQNLPLVRRADGQPAQEPAMLLRRLPAVVGKLQTGAATARKPKAACLWCGDDFDPVRKAQEFCCPAHQQAFNNFWKGKGPTLAKALHAWRVGKQAGGLTKVCQEFAAAREELKDKMAVASGSTKRKK